MQRKFAAMFVNDDIQQRWWNLEAKLAERFGKKPDVEAILFLIGLQEKGFEKKKISKEQKQDLMHIATCKVLSFSGIYELEGLDPEGWPHWNLVQNVPPLGLKEQEILLKAHVIQYFKEEVFT